MELWNGLPKNKRICEKANNKWEGIKESFWYFVWEVRATREEVGYDNKMKANQPTLSVDLTQRKKWESEREMWLLVGLGRVCLPPSLSIYLLEMELVFYSLFGSDFKQ